MFWGRLAACAAIIVMPATATAQAKTTVTADCWRPDEAAAARIRNFQMMLMVESLKCRDTIPSTLESYNAFMNAKHDTMVANKYLVQAHFVRKLGSNEGANASSDYETRLGNQTSSPVISVDRCGQIETLSRLGASASDADLVVLADMVAKNSAIEDCPVTAAAGKPTAMVIPIWKKPVIAAVAAIDPAPTTPVATPAVVRPTSLDDATAVAPTEPSAVADVPVAPMATAPAAVPVAPTGGDATKALQAAAVALSQAVSALQAQTAAAGGSGGQ